MVTILSLPPEIIAAILRELSPSRVCPADELDVVEKASAWAPSFSAAGSESDVDFDADINAGSDVDADADVDVVDQSYIRYSSPSSSEGPFDHFAGCHSAWFLRASLNSLSLTCKALHQHANRALYSRPFIVKGGKYVSLVRTICKRPDLAQAVRELYVGVGWRLEQGQAISADEVAFFNEHIASLPKLDDGMPVSVSPTWHCPDPGGEPGPNQTLRSPRHVLAALVLTHTPQLEKLVAMTYTSGNFAFCRPGSLPRLQSLALFHRGFSRGLDLATTDHIFLAAPALARLHAHGVGATSRTIHHSGISKLSLARSSLTRIDLLNLLSGFEALDSFVFASGGVPTFDNTTEVLHRQIPEAVVQRRDTLKHMSLNLSDHYGPIRWTEDCIRSLDDMTVLEELELHAAAFGGELYNEPIPEPDVLIDILPPSIRVLSIILPCADSVTVSRAIIRLSEAISSSERLPRFKLIMRLREDLSFKKAIRVAFETQKTSQTGVGRYNTGYRLIFAAGS